MKKVKKVVGSETYDIFTLRIGAFELVFRKVVREFRTLKTLFNAQIEGLNNQMGLK